MIDEKTANLLSQWFSNQLLSHSEDIADEMKGAEDGQVKANASVTFRRIAGNKYQIKCKFKIPRESIETEDSFDMQLQLPGM